MMMNNAPSINQPNFVAGGSTGGPPTAQSVVLTQNAELNFEYLYNLTPIEVKDEYDDKLARCYGQVWSILMANKQSEQQANQEMVKRLNSATTSYVYEEINIGLLVCILIDPQNAQRYYRDLTAISNDGHAILLHQFTTIITDRYPKLSDLSRPQVLWLLKEFLRNNVQNLEQTFHGIFRCIISGDLSPKNLWLTECLLDMMIEFRPQVERMETILSYSLFTFLRLLLEHNSRPALRVREIHYCADLLRNHFPKFISIGRDLVRALQCVASIPEFQPIWRDLLNTPAALAPPTQFQGLSHLLRTRSPRRIFRLRIPVDLENKLRFLLQAVRQNQHRRYVEWIARQYLSTPESAMLKVDIIRFVVCTIHPTNDILASDIISRWLFFAWIFNTVGKDQLVMAHCKLALYFDWLAFDSKDEGNNWIMDIEPGFLLIMNAVKMNSYPAMNLEFLCRIVNEFHPSLKNMLRDGISRAFLFMKEKKVGNVVQIYNVLENSRFDPKLRQMIRETFPDFYGQLRAEYMQQQMPPAVFNGQQQQQPPPTHSHPIMMTSDYGQQTQPSPNELITSNFSDDEDETSASSVSPPSKKLKKSNSFNGGSGGPKTKTEPDTVGGHRNKSMSQHQQHHPMPITPSGNEDMLYNIMNTAAGTNGNTSNKVKVIVVGGSGNDDVNSNGVLENSINNNQVMSYMDAGSTVENEVVIINNSIYHEEVAEADGFVFPEELLDNRLSHQEFLDHVSQFRSEPIKQLAISLADEADNQKRCDLIERFVRALLDYDAEMEEDEIEEFVTPITIVLLHLLRSDLLTKFPKHLHCISKWQPPAPEIDETIKKPLFIMFDFLSGAIMERNQHSSKLKSQDDDNDDDDDDDDAGSVSTSTRTRVRNDESLGDLTILRHLIAQMGTNCAELGYLMLYYLFVKEHSNRGFPVYQKYVKDMNKELPATLLEDIRCCARLDSLMLNYLACVLFREFPSILVNNVEVVELLLANCDPFKLQHFYSNIISESCKFFKRDSISALLEQSLKWNYTQQVFLWKLLELHTDIQVDHMLSLLPKINFFEHPEAVNVLTRRISSEGPTQMQVKALMSRDNQEEHDEFVYNILALWLKNPRKSETLAEYVVSFVNGKVSMANKRNKRAANNLGKTFPGGINISSILFHIDEMKIVDYEFISSNTDLIQCLVELKKMSTDEQKKTYHELFSLIPSDHEDNSTNSPGSPSSSKTTTKKSKKTSSASSLTNKKRTTNNSKEAAASASSSTANNNNTEDDEDTEDDDSGIVFLKQVVNLKPSLSKKR